MEENEDENPSKQEVEEGKGNDVTQLVDNCPLTMKEHNISENISSSDSDNDISIKNSQISTEAIDIGDQIQSSKVTFISSENNESNDFEKERNRVAEGTLKGEIEVLKNEKDTLKVEIKELREQLDLHKAKKFTDINALKGIVLALKQEKECLTSDINGFGQDMGTWLYNMKQSTQVSIASLERRYQRDDQEKRELLSEMTSMNEELNRRGETISSLKEVVSMYEKKVIELNSQQDCSMSTIKQLRDELTDRTQRLHDLSNQQDINTNIISQLREELSNTSQRLQDLDSQQNVSNDTIKQLRDQLMETTQRLHTSEAELARARDTNQGEVDRLSTSTVSRVEEAGRLRDVEDSFEDRYCKLKIVAAKLKKRATETQQQLDTERQKWASEKNELANKLNQLNASARNNQTLQQELDKLGDQLETERKECKMLRKAATDAKTSEVNLKVKLEEAQTNIEILKINLDSAVKERDSITQTLMSKEAELETALKEKVAQELISKEKMKEITELEGKLKEEQEKISGLKKAVESGKLEARKGSVLSLEIQNYEKSLSDMNSQLTAEKGRVTSLEAEVQTLQDIRDSLQEQIRLLEDRVSTEETRCQQAHDQLKQTRASLQAAEDKVGSLDSQVIQLTERLENERASAEAAALELASLSSAVQTNTDIMLGEKQQLSHQVGSLTAQLSAAASQLEQTEAELASVRADFEKYKVRAQSVLRKHQNTAVSQAELDAQLRVSELTTLNETLNTKLDQAATEIEKLQQEMAVVSREREVAESRCVNLNVALSEKTQQLERAVAEHRSQKLSLDTLVNCYKSQLEEKEKTLQEHTVLIEELEALRRQLRDKREESPPIPIRARDIPTEQAAPAVPLAKPEPPLLEREDGEGSEYIPDYSPSNTPPRVSPKPLLPLDKLLESNDSLHGEKEQLEGELNSVQAELDRSRKRAHHQAALLAETEQDAARKEQLITVLKKEIGRLERCIQRQPHAQNTEYLKNIVFKFVTLETGEDRLRLVPVISTLLQLSPEEINRLTDIAKGQSPDSASGWGGYFSAWR